ncbi:MAG: hypothetical protein P8I62_03330 [Pseudomonadales bacterium]|nr:hypothetical protein [Pseudomonadales bacterium]
MKASNRQNRLADFRLVSTDAIALTAPLPKHQYYLYDIEYIR